MSRALSVFLSLLLILSLGLYLLYNGGLIDWLVTVPLYQGAVLLISLAAGLGIHFGSTAVKKNPSWEQGKRELVYFTVPTDLGNTWLLFLFVGKPDDLRIR